MDKMEILGKMGIKESLAEMQEILGQIDEGDVLVATIKNKISQVEEALQYQTAQLLIDGVEGKNEKEREARLKFKLRADPRGKNLFNSQAGLLSDQANAEAHVASLKRRYGFLRVLLETRQAQLYFLGGVDHDNGKGA